ncbi:ABC transporter permease [Rhodococcus sp. BP-349]|uniref:ABC transporter permease n=1 Tax=unclassified Rhodococcus (in: high G+C Gram-positive bacteria) TaxID=192944 RepID=UPI001C9B6D43|nr:MULTISPECIES: ABC transporter permease [unclassified Rhodococcus (in: high G+C Gram-positive bacteria)]MBY6540174.1 ABC transporter permease [Rhodococcus sp. BP-363]MBY6543498.1 ABC transporter permease [Rhodococcus sp. BP-369]MBY6562728.1 ABC transporter permease [Rhodococcus sp. BP-370]MBY6577020.1 ABC transporter permease [Rhodococcus sp. BP-364]MBY6586321.1 ABC transporter permease [Rhodococcus sp. BP-358]
MSTSIRAERGERVGRYAPALLLAAGLVAAWQVYVVVSGISPRVLPSPARVVDQGWTNRAVIAGHASSTVQVTLLGFAVSLTISWIIATAVDFSPWLRRAVVPLLVVSQTLPVIAVAPLMIIWFGFGILPKLLVIALVTFFPMTLGLIEGFASADKESDALLRSMGASRRQQFRYVRLPSALPRFFTALRIGITYAVVGAVFSEYVGATSGLGIYMAQQKNAFRTDLVLAAVVVTAVCSIALFLLTFVAERLLAPWALAAKEGTR